MDHKKKDQIKKAVIVYSIFIGTPTLWWWFLSVYFSGYTIWGRVGWCMLFSLATYFCIGYVVAMIYRAKNGQDPFDWEIKCPREAKRRMSDVMRFGHEHGTAGALKEFKAIFEAHPGWKLQKWTPFRSWYKYKIDSMLEFPDVYKMSLGDGRPYEKEDDPLYDPDAPDWLTNYLHWYPSDNEL